MVFAPLTTWQVVHMCFLARSSLAWAGSATVKARLAAERINDFMGFLSDRNGSMLPKFVLFASAAQVLERTDRCTASNATAQPAVDRFRAQGFVQERRQSGGAVIRGYDEHARREIARQFGAPLRNRKRLTPQYQDARRHQEFVQRHAQLAVARRLVTHLRIEQFKCPLCGACIAVVAGERRKPPEAPCPNPVARGAGICVARFWPGQ